MKNDALKDVRELKLQGLSDEEISRHLATKYPTQEVVKSIEALQYMRSAVEKTELPDYRNNSEVHSVLSHRKKMAFLIAGGVLFFLTIPLYSLGLQFLQKKEFDRIDSILADKYDVDVSYTAGVTKDCTISERVGFGDLTGNHFCYKTVAKLYYPKITIEQNRITNLRSNPPTEFVQENLTYVTQKGAPLFQYINNADSWRRGQPHPHSFLELKDNERINFSYLDSLAIQSPQSDVKGKWNWNWDSLRVGGGRYEWL